MEQTEKLETKPILQGKNGGYRPNSGRKPGGMNQKTLEKLKVLENVRQRVLKNADKLFDAQMSLAQGCSFLYKIVETGKGKDIKKEHVLVDDPEEIKQYLDGEVGEEVYYYLTTKQPDNKAIDSLFDRAFGKATQIIEGTGENGEIVVKLLSKGNGYQISK